LNSKKPSLVCEKVFSMEEKMYMNRREILALTAAFAAQLVGCGGDIKTPTSPEPPSEKPQAPPPTPSVVIDTRKVGVRKFSVASPATGNLYYDVLPQIKSLLIGTRQYDHDRVTGVALNGYAVVAVNGDLGPEFTNALGEKTNAGWVVGIGNQHGFYDSIMDVYVKKDEQIDFYYGLPCSNPVACG
jgi:hypothetical protein